MAYTVEELKASRDTKATAYETQKTKIESMKKNMNDIQTNIICNGDYCKWKRSGHTEADCRSLGPNDSVPELSKWIACKKSANKDDCGNKHTQWWALNNSLPEQNILLTTLKRDYDNAQQEYQIALDNSQKESTVNLYEELGKQTASKETQTNVGTIAMAVVMLIVLFVVIKLLV